VKPILPFAGTASKPARAYIVVPWLLAGFAVIYYALYAACGLNLGGEGGTAGVVAMRLMAGQRPIVDTFLGYNVMWFVPVTWLFDLTGPNYLALRWYFFAFCTASGLLVYFVVFGKTRNAWFSAVPAILAILVPGMLFRNYMPFLGILNAFLLTRAFVLPHAARWKALLWIAAAGAGIGLTFLFRIDLGVFFLVIFFGLAGLYPFGEREAFLRRAALSAAGAICGVCLMVAVHLPVWSDARQRGYEEAFLAQYTGWTDMISREFRNTLDDLGEKTRPPSVAADPAAPAATAQPAAPAPKPTKVDTWEERGALARATPRDMWAAPTWSARTLAISTYMAIGISLIVIVAGGLALLVALIRRDLDAKERALYPLTVLGCALALFPQYYFFRPDTVHLAEMMVPFLAALALLVWESWRIAASTRIRAAKPVLIAFAAACAACAGIYTLHALPKASAGTIAARKKASHPFHAANGVNVKVRQREALWLAGLRDAVLRNSGPGEFVLCLPYSPTVNFMTDRPSPLHNLYVDNATAGSGWHQTFLSMMRNDRPAVVLVCHRAINGNKASRFPNWAPDSYRWLQQNYTLVGRYERNEIFARPDKSPPGTAPEFLQVSD